LRLGIDPPSLQDTAGEVAEWSNAPDSKSGSRLCRDVGSNPTLSTSESYLRAHASVHPAESRVVRPSTASDCLCTAKCYFRGRMADHFSVASQSDGASPLASSAPTSAPSGCPSSRSAVAASCATLLLPPAGLVCCIDRLNPQTPAVIGSEPFDSITLPNVARSLATVVDAESGSDVCRANSLTVTTDPFRKGAVHKCLLNQSSAAALPSSNPLK
jgi:hypothetical protein